MTVPAMVLLGEIAPQTEVPPAVDVTVDLLPVDVSCTCCQLLWATQFAAALPDMSPRPAAELTLSGPQGACMTQLTQQIRFQRLLTQKRTAQILTVLQLGLSFEDRI